MNASKKMMSRDIPAVLTFNPLNEKEDTMSDV
jgi:hypothetical protein